MIRTLDGDVSLRGDFGALFAFSASMIAMRVDKQRRGNRLFECGLPFFDDLDFYTKALALADVTNAMFDMETSLPETAWHAATLTAICTDVEKNVIREIEMRGWSQRKYGKVDSNQRAMVRAAYQSYFPERIGDLQIEPNDKVGYLKLAKRLIAEVQPPAYFWLADIEPEKRANLIQRLEIPNDYFEMPFQIEKMTKTAMRDRCWQIVGNILVRCMAVMTKESSAILKMMMDDQEQ